MRLEATRSLGYPPMAVNLPPTGERPMPQLIVFPDTPPPIYLISLDALSFPALADGKPVDCIVTAELLLAPNGLLEIS
jgi:hypothetical protein